MRFAAVQGVLMPGRELPGRGVYTCASAECFEEANSRRAFARRLRTAVVVEPSLARLYTEGSNG